MTSINIDDFPIEIDSVFFIACYRLLSIPIDFGTSISIDFRHQSILIGRLNGLISMISIDFRYRFGSRSLLAPKPGQMETVATQAKLLSESVL